MESLKINCSGCGSVFHKSGSPQCVGPHDAYTSSGKTYVWCSDCDAFRPEHEAHKKLVQVRGKFTYTNV